MRTLLASLCRHVASIKLISTKPKLEVESSFTRQVGYESVQVQLYGMNKDKD